MSQIVILEQIHFDREVYKSLVNAYTRFPDAIRMVNNKLLVKSNYILNRRILIVKYQ